MRGLGFEFTVEPPDESVERGVVADNPEDLAELIAWRKCDNVASRFPNHTVIAADTMVVVDGDVMTKPDDDNQAVDYLRRLSGRTHTVVTGVALQCKRSLIDVSGREVTRVTFRALDDVDIERYVATGEGRDKAGSYAAQGFGAALIQSFDGCFYNVVGLPVALLFDLLRRAKPAKLTGDT